MDSENKKINIKKRILIFVIISIIYFLGLYLLMKILHYSINPNELGHGFGNFFYTFCCTLKLLFSFIISFLFLFYYIISLIVKKFSKKYLYIPLYLTVAFNTYMTISYISGSYAFKPFYNFIVISFIELPMYIPFVILYFIVLTIDNLYKAK